MDKWIWLPYKCWRWLPTTHKAKLAYYYSSKAAKACRCRSRIRRGRWMGRGHASHRKGKCSWINSKALLRKGFFWRRLDSFCILFVATLGRSYQSGRPFRPYRREFLREQLGKSPLKWWLFFYRNYIKSLLNWRTILSSAIWKVLRWALLKLRQWWDLDTFCS